MLKSPIINPKACRGWVSRNTVLGTATYDLDNLYSPDTAYDQACVLNLASPKYNTNATTIFDKSIYNTHGTITGATWVRLPSGFRGLSFNGTSYVELTNTIMNFTTSDFSILIWGVTTNLTDDNFVLIRGLHDTEGYYISISGTGRLRLYTAQATVTQNSQSGAGTVVVGKIYQWGCSRSGASVRIYINGVDNTAIAGTHLNPTTSNRTVKVGIFDDKASFPLIGRIYKVSVFSLALTPTQIADTFNRERHLFGV